MTNELPYDPSDKSSIISYAKKLEGSTLAEHVDITSIDDPQKRKGSFGNAVEQHYFMYRLNSDSAPDFDEVGLELKTTPMKKDKKGNLRAKERLVITMISYAEVVNETFETSSFLHKANDMLLLVYLYEPNKNPMEYEVKLVEEWTIPEEDLPIFKQDWELVVNKVRAGRAEAISGGDTLYLEACTKATNSKVTTTQPFSDVPAKPRAWAIKASYMSAIENKLLTMQSIKVNADEKELTLLELVKKRFSPYFGMTIDELAQHFGYSNSRKAKPKNLTALIAKQILGVSPDAQIAQFEKAGIKPKAIRLKLSGLPKESMSLPAFKYDELVKTSFEESRFYQQLQQKYLFIIYREDATDKDVYKLSELAFWQMPEVDLEEAQRCYDEMRARTKAGRAEDSVLSTENRCCHVRPHGRNSQDTWPAPPDGKPVVKKCFWFNARYLADEIKRITTTS